MGILSTVEGSTVISERATVTRLTHCAARKVEHLTYLHTSVFDVVITVLRDPFRYQALAMVFPNCLG